MSVQPVERTSSVQASGVQASAASRCPDGQALVSAALSPLSVPPWTWSGSGGGPPRPGAAGRRAAAVCGRRGRLPASGRTGRDGAALAVAGSHEVDRSQGRCVAGVPAAALPWPQRADTGAGPGPGCRPGGGGAWDGAGAHRPCRASWGVAGVVSGHGPGPRGGNHAGWSLGEGGPVASSSTGPTRFGGGAACGRGAAAARGEGYLLGAARSLTSENSGGRDRV
jgi:hypothetical protein